MFIRQPLLQQITVIAGFSSIVMRTNVESLLFNLFHFPMHKVGCTVLDQPFASLFDKGIFVNSIECCLHLLVALLSHQYHTAVACCFCFVTLQINCLLTVLMINCVKVGKET